MDNRYRLLTVLPYPLRPSSPWKLETKASVAGKKSADLPRRSNRLPAANEMWTKIKTEGTNRITQVPGGLTIEKGVK